MPDDPNVFHMPPPEPTGSLWAGMFGLGPLMRLIQDPGLAAQAQKAVQAIIDGHAAQARIEAKLDHLIRVLGHEPPTGRIGELAALPARIANGAGGLAPATTVVDLGSGGATSRPGTVGGDADGRGDASGGDGGDDRAGPAARLRDKLDGGE